jgi:hypothetical protein
MVMVKLQKSKVGYVEQTAREDELFNRSLPPWESGLPAMAFSRSHRRQAELSPSEACELFGHKKARH